MWTFFSKSLLNLLQYCLYFVSWFFWPQGTWNLGCLARVPTHTPCFGRQSLNHWTTREVPFTLFLIEAVTVLQFSLPILILSLKPSKFPLTPLFLFFWNRLSGYGGQAGKIWTGCSPSFPHPPPALPILYQRSCA